MVTILIFPAGGQKDDADSYNMDSVHLQLYILIENPEHYLLQVFSTNAKHIPRTTGRTDRGATTTRRARRADGQMTYDDDDGTDDGTDGRAVYIVLGSRIEQSVRHRLNQP